MFKPNHTPAHAGRRTTADPLTSTDTVNQVKALLKTKPRDLALWTLAVNSMLRAGDLVKLKWTDLVDDGETITIRLQQGKTKKPISVLLPAEPSKVIRVWQELCGSDFIFASQRGTALTVPAWSRMVKFWCESIGLEGNFSSHTTRKSGARIRYEAGVSLATLMHLLSHGDERTSMIYLGKMDENVKAAYNVVL